MRENGVQSSSLPLNFCYGLREKICPLGEIVTEVARKQSGLSQSQRIKSFRRLFWVRYLKHMIS